jgi:hypothetical protein
MVNTHTSRERLALPSTCSSLQLSSISITKETYQVCHAQGRASAIHSAESQVLRAYSWWLWLRSVLLLMILLTVHANAQTVQAGFGKRC